MASSAPEGRAASAVHFYFDPICPFAWMTSKWVRLVASQRPIDLDWRFISLRMVNADVDYAARFPAGYEAGHTAGLKLLRVAARTRREHGPEPVGRLYEAFGTALFDTARGAQRDLVADARSFVTPLLTGVGLPAHLADALDDASLDDAIREDTDRALAATGRDVGTPIVHFDPPGGKAFFGPVISRLPAEHEALELWDHVTALAAFPGFAELKRSLREVPQLRAFGVDDGSTGAEEDWRQGSRRTS